MKNGNGSLPPPLEIRPKMAAKSEAMEDLMSIDIASLKPLMPTTMPEIGDFLDVNVTLAASPSNFTVSALPSYVSLFGVFPLHFLLVGT